MSNLPNSVFNLGNIVGLGESSHGSKNELVWKYELILEAIKNNPETKFVCFFEVYTDPLAKLMGEVRSGVKSLKEIVSSCIKKMYAILQTKETYDFLLELVNLVTRGGREIEIIGIDFKNKEHKQGMDTQTMLDMRDGYMFKSIKEHYQSEAVHVVIAHNAHIGRYSETEKSIGYLLDQEFKGIYLPVAQHVSEGFIRAKWNGGDYQPVAFIYDNTLGSVTSLANTVFLENVPDGRSLVFNTSESVFEGIDSIQQTGFYLPLEKSWIIPFGKQYFDYLILHPKSESAESL